jgi:glutathione S-transferase
MAPAVILFDYPFSPYAQKIRLLLAATGIPYKRCEQPNVLPRPTLLDLDITYRRIPLLSIGGDVYCDSSKIVEAIQEQFRGLETSPADRLYEKFADHTFGASLTNIPPQVLSPDFVKDREPIFPLLAIGMDQFKTLGPSGRRELMATMNIVETDLLANANPFIGGSKPALADIHLVWAIRWILKDLGVGQNPAFGKTSFPKIYKW